MSDKDDVKALILKHNRVLQKLKEQQASFGLHTPPYILVEIDDTEVKILELETELAHIVESVPITNITNQPSNPQAKIFDAETAHQKDLEPQDFVGMKINNYRIQQYVHSGGFGSVFKAKHIHLDTIVAVKISHKVEVGFENLNEIVSIGLQGLRLLDHEYIVKTFDFERRDFGRDERLVIVMEYIDGGTLNDYIKSNLSKDEIWKRIEIFKKVCSGIYHAHTIRYRNKLGFQSVGLMHGDIKPANILMTRDKNPKIMDFMFVDMNRLLEIEVKAPDFINRAGFATDAFGTVGYMPPEQQIQGQVTEQTDIYALGILLFEILCPYKYSEMQFNSSQEIYTFLAQNNKDVPKFVSEIVFKATRPESGERYSNVHEIMSIIETKTDKGKKWWGKLWN